MRDDDGAAPSVFGVGLAPHQEPQDPSLSDVLAGFSQQEQHHVIGSALAAAARLPAGFGVTERFGAGLVPARALAMAGAVSPKMEAFKGIEPLEGEQHSHDFSGIGSVYFNTAHAHS